jgi:hypothetical protein
MATKLEKPLRREIRVGDEAYIVTIAPEGLKLTAKGKRKGLEMAWADMVSGQAALATALNASLERMPSA